VFRVQQLSQLVYLDTDDVRADYDGRITGTTVVFPDATYDPFRDLNRRLREAEKQGVVYPSARHSVDCCFAFFDDQSGRVRNDLYEILNCELRLVPETQSLRNPPGSFDSFLEKSHPTMGYYSFLEPTRLAALDANGLINPSGLPPAGMIDFVRRRYLSYPSDAVCC